MIQNGGFGFSSPTDVTRTGLVDILKGWQVAGTVQFFRERNRRIKDMEARKTHITEVVCI